MLGRFVNAKEMSEILKRDHGLDLSESRLLSLGYLGEIPCVSFDRSRIYFEVEPTKEWIEASMVHRVEPGESPDVPDSLGFVSGSLREIPTAQYRFCCGVYFLIRDGEVVYVDQSLDLMARLASHFKDKAFDRILMLPVPQEDLNRVELAFIRRLSPVLNSANKVGIPRPTDIDLNLWFSENRQEEIDRLDRHAETMSPEGLEAARKAKFLGKRKVEV